MPVNDAASDKAVRDQLRHLKLKGRSAVTISHREKMLGHVADFLPVPLLEATPEMLYDWRASLQVSDASAAGYISHVRGFYAFCVERGLLETDPAKDLPVPAVARLLPRPIATADLAHALDHASRKIRLMLILAAYPGLRAKEIACLRAENVRMRDEQPVIIIASGGTKGHAERSIPMSPAVIAEFVLAGLPPATGPVFPAADGVSHLKPWMVSKICNAHLHACGIASTLHSLRHWCATTVYAIDNDLLAVKDLLGHARLETTANYAKLYRPRTAALLNAMPAPGSLGKKEAS
jgi:integrase